MDCDLNKTLMLFLIKMTFTEEQYEKFNNTYNNIALHVDTSKRKKKKKSPEVVENSIIYYTDEFCKLIKILLHLNEDKKIRIALNSMLLPDVKIVENETTYASNLFREMLQS